MLFPTWQSNIKPAKVITGTTPPTVTNLTKISTSRGGSEEPFVFDFLGVYFLISVSEELLEDWEFPNSN